MKRLSFTAFSLVLLTVAAARADVRWTVTTADFARQGAGNLTLDEKGARFAPPGGGAETQLSWDQFLSAEQPEPAIRPGGPFVLHLRNGDRVAGEPVGVEGESLKWKAAAAGELAFPLQRVAAVVRVEHGQAPAGETTEDVVTLANGDTARGILAAISGTEVTVQAQGGDPAAVPLGSIVSIQLAAAGGAKDAASGGRAFRVRLTDDSVLTAATVALTPQKVSLDVGGASRDVAVEYVAGIEQLNGPVAWLSSLAPAESVHTPFLDTARPARMDRSVLGGPIRFGDKLFARGVGVHSRSRITWPIDPAYTAFRTQYAIDGDMPYANVTVRVLLDGKVAHEKADFTAGQLAPVVQVPLNGAKQITLEVDYGQTYDVQDRFNWIEPALLKAAPPPAPATTQP